MTYLPLAALWLSSTSTGLAPGSPTRLVASTVDTISGKVVTFPSGSKTLHGALYRPRGHYAVSGNYVA
jgi:hypothetical protein